MLKKIKKTFLRGMMGYDITLEELKQKQLTGSIIIDVRNKRAYDEGHIEGSINIPEYEINGLFTKIIPNKDTSIVVYCSSGYRSVTAYKKLKKMGYTHVYTLYGGLDNY